MTHGAKSDRQSNPPDRPGTLPLYAESWDRDLNIYNVLETPMLPADGEPGAENLPVGLRILREFCLDAAAAFALELWFDFAPDGAGGMVDVCWSSERKGTSVVRIPRSLLLEGDDELGIFGALLSDHSDFGIFAVSVGEFNDLPRNKHNPWDSHGRLVPPPPEPDEPIANETPGFLETLTIRAFHLALKGHKAPEDFVIQICPRFWHMPTGLQVG
jgi:hypothetical protein